jgi:O-antigen ligase
MITHPIQTPENIQNNHKKVIGILCAMLVMLPATGSFNEFLLQDTLKSAIASLSALTALTIFLIHNKTIKFHRILWAPSILFLHAGLSALYSHSYLAYVELIRWAIFSIIVLLVTNCATKYSEIRIAWSIHCGAIFAALWGSLQFWNDFQLFAQGPKPASTFVNKNFFAEFMVCSLPMAGIIIRNSKQNLVIYSTIIAIAFELNSIFITGCRSAIVMAIIISPFLFYLSLSRKRNIIKLVSFFILITSVFLFQKIPSGLMPKEVTQPLSRASSLLNQDEYVAGSSGIRLKLWNTSINMLKDKYVTGVGAGAWEVQAPRYQENNQMLEIDYYAHNEYLQLLAEYGIAGILSIVIFVSSAFIRSKENYKKTNPFFLMGFFALAGVSLTGFPWHLAGTLSLLAVYTGLLIARNKSKTITIPTGTTITALTCGTAIVTCIYVTFLAFECERKLITAIKLCYTIVGSADPMNEQWNPSKERIIKLTNEAISINPHYRKLTPIVAESILRWNDVKNSIAIYESIHQSRPYVGAIIVNLAHLNHHIGNEQKSRYYFDQLKKINRIKKS